MPIQRIMVRAEVRWRGVASRRSIEHPAQSPAINDAAVHAESHDATRAVVHHHENPVRAQNGPAESASGWYRAARIRRTTSLFMGKLARETQEILSRLSIRHALAAKASVI